MRADVQAQTAIPFSLSISLKYRSQAAASKCDSRGSSGVNIRHEKACCGQTSTQAVQAPHRGSMGKPVGSSGALVRMVTHRTLGPWSGVTSRQLFPIQPSPARCAASFWEKMPLICSLSVRFEAGMGNASKPALRRVFATRRATWSRARLTTS